VSVSILIGDVREKLAGLPADHFDCVVTSPPYWGLRDYGTATWEGGDPACDHRSPTMREGRDEQRAALAGSAATNSAQLLLAHRTACGKCGAMKVDRQIGLEPTMGEHIAVMVDVFEQIRRVVKPTGTVWLNYGDCYATTPNGRSAADQKAAGTDDRTFRDKPISTIGGGKRAGRSENLGNTAGDGVRRNVADGCIKAKDLLMLPNRLAIALQDAGWWVRAECIWGKPNAMPDSSGSQRPSTAHEKGFMLAKAEDGPIWRARDTGELSFAPDLSERCPLVTDPDRTGVRWLRIGSYYDAEAVKQGRAGDEDANGFRGGSYVAGAPGPRAVRGNRRVKAPDGWDTRQGGHGSFHREGREKGKTRAVSPRHEGHINHTGVANTPRGEGRYLRNYEPAPLQIWEIAIEPFKGKHFATFPQELVARCLRAGCPPGGKVLDPFGGSGTTGLVADAFGLDCTLIELSEEYAEIAAARLRAGLVEVQAARGAASVVDLPLFAEVDAA